MILAVDPGNEKTGVAVVNEDKSLVKKDIVPTIDLKEEIRLLLRNFSNISTIVCGNGTNHKHLYPLLQAIAQEHNIKVSLTDEAHTTEEARKRYWDYNSPTGLKRLIPRGMLFPPEPVDDFTAWIIGERYLQKYDDK